MNWIIYSVLMFVASVVMYLLVRLLQVRKVDNDLVTYSVGAIPVLFLGIFILFTAENILLTPRQYLIAAAIGVLLSYLGNKYSVQAVQKAPNPGYSLIIQKGYAPYTALMAYFLFNSELTVITIVAIVMIVVSAAQVMIDPRKSKKVMDMNWIWLSFVAFFAFGTLALTAKFLLDDGVKPVVVVFYTFLFASIAFTIDYARKLNMSKIQEAGGISIGIIVLIGLLNALFNVFMQEGFKLAPNVGYVNIINASSITAIALLSAVFFKDKLTIQKIFGIIGVTCGLVLLFL